MTNCCQCDGVTPPPPPAVGSCCSLDVDTALIVCEDGVNENDCLSRPVSTWDSTLTCSQRDCTGDPPTCFTGDSLVLMEDGSHRKISEVSVGETVKSINGEVNTVLHIEKTILGGRKLSSINGSSLFFSYDHPIVTQQGFKSLNSYLSRKLYSDIEFVGDLELGDIIFTEDGGEASVEDLHSEHSAPYTALYDLSLDGNHIYFVNGVAFHNCSYGSACCYDGGIYLGCASIGPPRKTPLEYCKRTFSSSNSAEKVGGCEQCPEVTTTAAPTTTTSYDPHGACCVMQIDRTQQCIDNFTFSQCFSYGPFPTENLFYYHHGCDDFPCGTTSPPTTTTATPEVGCCISATDCFDADPALCLAMGGTVLSVPCELAGPDPCASAPTTTPEPPTTTTAIPDGACCGFDGYEWICTDGVAESDCRGIEQAHYPTLTCAEVACETGGSTTTTTTATPTTTADPDAATTSPPDAEGLDESLVIGDDTTTTTATPTTTADPDATTTTTGNPTGTGACCGCNCSGGSGTVVGLGAGTGSTSQCQSRFADSPYYYYSFHAAANVNTGAENLTYCTNQHDNSICDSVCPDTTTTAAPTTTTAASTTTTAAPTTTTAAPTTTTAAPTTTTAAPTTTTASGGGEAGGGGGGGYGP
jgi:hypothetical protein